MELFAVLLIFIIVLIPIIAVMKFSSNKRDRYSNDSVVLQLPTASRTKSRGKTKKTYSRIIRNDSNNNMNCSLYNFSGKYIQTNRKRSNNTLYLFSGENIETKIKSLGYTDPIEYQLVDFPKPTDKQLDYLHDLSDGHVPKNVCRIDVSALISQYVDDDRGVPNPELFDYAEQMKIPVSYYCGKKRLYNEIFYGLERRDKIAFFAFQVYRYKYNDHSVANLNNSSHKNLFYKFADMKLSDDKFLKSMNGYYGEDLRVFGTHSYNGYEYIGGSTRTIAYKDTVAFLQK